MNRRRFLGSSALALGAAACSAPSDVGKAADETTAHTYHMRYAPRIGWLQELSIPQQLELYASHGFRAFEYNGLPHQHSLEEGRAVPARRPGELEMEMGVFVVNSGGWKGDALCDKKFHAGFLKDVEKAVEYHKVIRNGWSTVTSGLAVDYLSHKQQTEAVIEGFKRRRRHRFEDRPGAGGSSR